VRDEIVEGGFIFYEVSNYGNIGRYSQFLGITWVLLKGRLNYSGGFGGLGEGLGFGVSFKEFIIGRNFLTQH